MIKLAGWLLSTHLRLWAVDALFAFHKAEKEGADPVVSRADRSAPEVK